MSKKRYLKSHKNVVRLWDLHLEGKTSREIGLEIGLTPSPVNRWVHDIEAALSGTPVWKIRRRSQKQLAAAIGEIKARDDSSGTDNTPSVDIPKGNTEETLSQAWEGFQKALGQYVEGEIATKHHELLAENTRLKELAEEAKKSNKLGFLTRNWRN